jgi:uncharacterized protein (DUF885 family)
VPDPQPQTATSLSAVYRIASDYVERVAELNPIAATSMGVRGHDHEMPDLSPAGAEARADLAREMLAALRAAPLAGERDRVAKEVMEERLELALQLHDARDDLRDLAVLGSSVQSVRSTFDLMPRDSAEAWDNIARRLHRVSDALAGIRASLEEGLARDVRGTRRQAYEVARQARVWSGVEEGTRPFFDSLVEAYQSWVGGGQGSEMLRDDLRAGAQEAAGAYAALAEYLEERYAPRAEERDAVGAERYALHARAFTGATLNLEETYRWGWEELARLERELDETADRIAPGQPLAEVRRLLDAGEAGPAEGPRVVEGVEAFRQWMQDLQDRTIGELEGRHFEIPDPVRRIEAMIAPPGGALAMYYTGPSEDFSRPGRTWYPADGKTRFPVWPEVSVAYHEGIPGHHLQIAMVRYLSEQLSRYQRLLASTSGYVEGWGLYAERLMAELGYLEEPSHYLGMLIAQAFRAARVVVDIGMHLELPIPAASDFHPGERWTPALGFEFMAQRTPFDERFARSEIDRYLGMPGQAISYKVGERYWLEARAAAQAREAASFDLKAWHARALALGPMGLDQMRRELGG